MYWLWIKIVSSKPTFLANVYVKLEAECQFGVSLFLKMKQVYDPFVWTRKINAIDSVLK